MYRAGGVFPDTPRPPQILPGRRARCGTVRGMVPVLAQILGALLVVAGVAMLSTVAALIVAGLMLLAAGTLAELPRDQP